MTHFDILCSSEFVRAGSQDVTRLFAIKKKKIIKNLAELYITMTILQRVRLSEQFL